MKTILFSFLTIMTMSLLCNVFLFNNDDEWEKQDITGMYEEFIIKDTNNLNNKLSLYIEPNPENMFMVCEYIGIKHPDIVTAQAVLESGYFQSKVFKEKNNPFGLYDSKNKDYFSFDNWIESVYGYKNMIEYKYNGKNKDEYFSFLIDLPYAEDIEYITKLKNIIDKFGFKES